MEDELPEVVEKSWYAGLLDQSFRLWIEPAICHTAP